jgi:hypothetical protein
MMLEIICFLCIFTSSSGLFCGPGFKPGLNGSTCVDFTNQDVLGAIHWLSDPPRTPHTCLKLSIAQGIAVCEDFLPSPLTKETCNIFSFIGSNWCDHYGSLAFERFWAEKGCNVTVYHYHIRFKGVQ